MKHNKNTFLNQSLKTLRAGMMAANNSSTNKLLARRRVTAFVAPLRTGALLLGMASLALAEPWDSSWNNPFVASGNGDQCTAYAWGRFEVLNEALRFSATSGRDGGRLYDLAIESPTVYRDSVPVRGALISWTKPNEAGHAAIVERANNDGSCDISEQNWPTGSGPSDKTLSAANMLRRSSTVKGVTTYFTLRGYVNPNRPPAFGTLYIYKTANVVQVQYALMDEDRRSVNLLSAIVDNGQVVAGTTTSSSSMSNNVVTTNFSNTSQLRRGRTYTLNVWATDFRGLRSSKSVTFTW